MSGRNRLILLGAVVALLIVGVLWFQTQGQSGMPEVVTQRQEAMKGLGGHMKAIGESIQSGSPDESLIAEHAGEIGKTASTIPSLFPEGTSLDDVDGKVGAKPAIWEDWAGFETAANNLGTEAAALAAAADGGDAAAIEAAFKSLGENGCGGCHTKFRQKTD
jgi:cytochrome c556